MAGDYDDKSILEKIVYFVLVGGAVSLLVYSRNKDIVLEPRQPEVRTSNEYVIREGDSSYMVKFVIDSAWYDPAYDEKRDR